MLAFLESRGNWHRARCDTEVLVNTAERVRVRAMINGDYLLLKNLSVFRSEIIKKQSYGSC
jgi:hypothetical protein